MGGGGAGRRRFRGTDHDRRRGENRSTSPWPSQQSNIRPFAPTPFSAGWRVFHLLPIQYPRVSICLSQHLSRTHPSRLPAAVQVSDRVLAGLGTEMAVFEHTVGTAAGRSHGAYLNQ